MLLLLQRQQDKVSAPQKKYTKKKWKGKSMLKWRWYIQIHVMKNFSLRTTYVNVCELVLMLMLMHIIILCIFRWDVETSAEISRLFYHRYIIEVWCSASLPSFRHHSQTYFVQSLHGMLMRSRSRMYRTHIHTMSMMNVHEVQYAAIVFCIYVCFNDFWKENQQLCAT